MNTLTLVPWRMQVTTSPEGHRIRLPLNLAVPVVGLFATLVAAWSWYQFAPGQLLLIVAAVFGVALLLRLLTVREEVVLAPEGLVLERHSALGCRSRAVSGEQLWDVEVKAKTETHHHHHHQDNFLLELFRVGDHTTTHVYSRVLWLHNYGDAPLELGNGCTEGELQWLRQAILDSVACPAAR